MFNIYKRGQGKWMRLTVAIGLAVPALLLCRQVYFLLQDRLPAFNGRLTAVVAGPVVVGLVCMWGILRLVNSPRSSDFLIETEGEMKKVSWPGKPDVVGATGVVIVTVLILAVFLFASDKVVEVFIRRVVKLF